MTKQNILDLLRKMNFGGDIIHQPDDDEYEYNDLYEYEFDYNDIRYGFNISNIECNLINYTAGETEFSFNKCTISKNGKMVTSTHDELLPSDYEDVYNKLRIIFKHKYRPIIIDDL